MEQISRDKAIRVFEEFSKSKLSSIKFSTEGSIYRFKPSALTINFLNILNLITLATPHLLYFFHQFSKNQQLNNVLYIIYTLLSILLVWMIVFLIAPYQIVINNFIKELELIPDDYIGKLFKKKKQIKIETIEDVTESRFKTKSGVEIYLNLVTKEGVKHRMFTLSNWDNITKLKTAFRVLLFNKEGSCDDSNEPSVVIDNTIEKLLAKKDGETSYLPLSVFISTILILFVGFFISVYFKDISYCGQIDSLWLQVLQYWAIAMLIYAIPIYFSGTTAYQKKKKFTRKTITIFSLIAMLGVYLCSSGLINYLNIKMDNSQPIPTQANVIDATYTSGSKNTRSYYTITLQISNIPHNISINHHDPNLQANLKSTISVSIFKGYFNKRWLRIDS